MPLYIVDTAGLRDSDNEIEQEGIRRAWAEIASADRILLVVDGNDFSNPSVDYASMRHESFKHLKREIPVTIINNKCDLNDRIPEVCQFDETTVISLSAKTGAGMDLLKKHLKNCMGYKDSLEGNFSARRRHLQSLELAKKYLLNGQQQLLQAGAGELLAEDLRLCQNSLGEITGAISSDELLGTIFSSFCIGK
jgi:tRNA modification GTPase